MAARARVRRSSLVVAIASALASAIVGLSSGFDVDAMGLRVTAHDPLRPLILASLALTVFILTQDSR
jgi:hypothetical protein